MRKKQKIPWVLRKEEHGVLVICEHGIPLHLIHELMVQIRAIDPSYDIVEGLIAEKLGANFAVGSNESLTKWREELGILV